MAKAFRDLRVWHVSVALSLSIYDLTEAFPKHELYGLSSQMRRAAVSIASNIAEGTARKSRKDYRHFITTALGSNYELQTQLLIAKHRRYADPVTIEDIERVCFRVARMLIRLEEYLNKSIAAQSKRHSADNPSQQ